MYKKSLAALACCAALVFTGMNTHAVEYTLHNHPDGNARPPLYGLRIDNLTTSGIHTWEFTGNGAGVSAAYDSVTGNLTILGKVYGGLNQGSGYAGNPNAPMLWDLSFTYLGLSTVSGDDDLWTTGNGVTAGMGTISNGSTTYDLAAKSNGTYSFRFGDENSDAGHRGFAGISGWGWLSFKKSTETAWQSHGDFLFTAAQNVPEGGSMALMLLGALSAMGMIRRRL